MVFLLCSIKTCIFQWRAELEEIIEVASLDSELWVSMLSEAMKTFPSTGSLNTDISDLDEHRPIFGDLVNDLRKLLRKQNDPAMLPLECHYLNKTALTSVVGQQPASTKHFTLKRKPKSAALRAELLQKSVDAANNLKKSTAPTVPVRSRGMPRKMTDTSKYSFKMKKKSEKNMLRMDGNHCKSVPGQPMFFFLPIIIVIFTRLESLFLPHYQV